MSARSASRSVDSAIRPRHCRSSSTSVTSAIVPYRRTADVTGLRHRVGGGATGLATGEQAAAEERTLQRAVPVHAAAAETGHLAGRVHAGQRLAVGAQDPAGKVGRKATEGLAGEDVQPY